MAKPYQLVSRDAQQALTEFSAEFDRVLALGGIDQWSARLGHSFSSPAIKTTYPIPLDAAGYRLRKGDDKLRSLYERSLSITTVEWSDGVSALLRQIEAPDFIGWGQAPANMAVEAQRHPNVLVADLLASNPLLDFYRDEFPGGSVASTIRLFASDHPVNILNSAFSTFSNVNVSFTEITPELIAAARLHFRNIKGPNGRPLGLRLGGLIVPAAHEEEARDLLERDTILEIVKNVAGDQNVGGIPKPNRAKGTPLVVADELTGILPSGASGDEDMIYAFAVRDGGAPAPSPWIVQDGGMEEITYSQEDALYKDTGKVGVKRILTAGATACLPHGILRFDLSPS
jgi:hypothetical protein